MRTNETDVKKIISTDLATGIIEEYISDANLFVTNILGGTDLDAATLESIEKWISAHFIAATQERQAKEEGAGGAYIKYGGDFGIGLKATMYGQQAILLDSTETLSALADGKKTITFLAM